MYVAPCKITIVFAFLFVNILNQGDTTEPGQRFSLVCGLFMLGSVNHRLALNTDMRAVSIISLSERKGITVLPQMLNHSFKTSLHTVRNALSSRLEIPFYFWPDNRDM